MEPKNLLPTYDIRLKHNASMIVAGPSQSGKTTFIQKLLKYRRILFDKVPEKMYWFYGVYQPGLHYQLREQDVEVSEGLPTDFNHIESNSIIVLDDLMSEATKQSVTQLFTRIAHHKNCFVIYVTQNLFERSSEARTRQLNAQYLVLFKNPRDSLQIRILGTQMYPNKKSFLTDVFRDATSRPHGYLFIDSHQETEDKLRIRANYLPDEKPMYAYYPKL